MEGYRRKAVSVTPGSGIPHAAHRGMVGIGIGSG